MEPTLTVAGHEAIDRDELLVHDWRIKQLKRLGIPEHLASGAAAMTRWMCSAAGNARSSP